MQTVGKTLSCKELKDIADELQHNNYYPSGDYKDPEKALLAAVLQRAIIDLLNPKGSATQKRLQEELRHWFSSEDRSYPFSFLRICEELDLEVSLLLPVLSERLLEK